MHLLRRWVLRLAILATALLLTVLGFAAWALLTCFAEPPELKSRPAILDTTIEITPKGRVRLGRSWYEPREGRSLLYLEGDPFSIGYANASLTAALLQVQEQSLIDTVQQFFPSRLGRYSIALLVLVNNRNLPSYVEKEYKLEILGLASPETGTNDPLLRFGSRYHRYLNYHAAHDISHWVWDQPVLGCSSFAVRGRRTKSGHLLLGRNFDWEAGPHFDRNKVIVLYRPERGHAFLSVSWPGMAGAVSGMNEHRLFCSINGAHSESQGRSGEPVSLVVRRVLQYADDLDSALAMVRQAQVFVADSFLVADGRSGEAMVIEKTPARCAVRPMEDDLLLQANHFESPALRQDKGNQAYMREGTSVARRRRLEELLRQRPEPLDPVQAVAVLRDRDGPGGARRALGHRSTINPMIATHSVLADLSAGILWVSRGPHQLGAYDAYSISDFGNRAPAETIPADPALASGDYQRLQEFRKVLAAKTLDASKAEALNPGHPTVLRALARAQQEEGDPDRALQLYKAALAAAPPFLKDREEIQASIRELEKQ